MKKGVLIFFIFLSCLFLSIQKQKETQLNKENIKYKDKIEQLQKKANEERNLENDNMENEEKEVAMSEGEKINVSFLRAYFDYDSYEVREKNCQLYLSKEAKDEVKMAIYDNTVEGQSFILSRDSFYKQVSTIELESFNKIKVMSCIGTIETTIDLVYQVNLKKIEGVWLVAQIEFLGSKIV